VVVGGCLRSPAVGNQAFAADASAKISGFKAFQVPTLSPFLSLVLSRSLSLSNSPVCFVLRCCLLVIVSSSFCLGRLLVTCLLSLSCLLATALVVFLVCLRLTC
jgi:hypothetical protein